jgi:hypothetical protein
MDRASAIPAGWLITAAVKISVLRINKENLGYPLPIIMLLLFGWAIAVIIIGLGFQPIKWVEIDLIYLGIRILCHSYRHYHYTTWRNFVILIKLTLNTGAAIKRTFLRPMGLAGLS